MAFHAGAQRMRNFESYYRDEQHWSAGPHLFVADDLIWVFSPLTTPGVHSPSWNAISWGIEMVGGYDQEAFSPAVRENTIDALATLHVWLGIDPAGLRFHKEDPRTTHKNCPGKNVVKTDMLARLQNRIAQLTPGEHLPTRIANDATVPTLASEPTLAGRRYVNINASEFGGRSDPETSAYDDQPIDPSAMEVALPARLPADQRKVRIFNLRNNQSVDAVVRDVGPWNTHDAYWEGSGRPLAEAQHRDGTVAHDGKVPSNDAGIDMTPAIFDALGIAGPEDTRQAHVDWMFT